MNSFAELKKAWETFNASINSTLETLEADLLSREAIINKRMAEVKQLDERFKQLAEEQRQVVYDRDMLEKERIILRDNKERMDMLDKRLQEKADRLQKILVD